MINRTDVLAIIAEQSRNHGKAAELWKDTPDKVAYHTGAVHVCGEIRDRIERMPAPPLPDPCNQTDAQIDKQLREDWPEKRAP